MLPGKLEPGTSNIPKACILKFHRCSIQNMLCRTSPETKRNEIKTYITDVAKVKWPKNLEEPRLQDGVYVCRIRNNGADITVMRKLEEL